MEKKFILTAFQHHFDYLMRLRTEGVVTCSSEDFFSDDSSFSIVYDYSDDISILKFDLPLCPGLHCRYCFKSKSLILRDIYENVKEVK